jgi:predicted transposase YdaD
LWFGTFLQRTDTVSIEDKRRIVEKMSNLESLLDENPFVQKRRAEGLAEGEAKGRAEGEAKGRAEGRAEGLQRAVITVVEGRFPPLAELAQKSVASVTKADALAIILKGMVTAPDEATARLLLELLAA